jgi:glutaredoxin 3
MADPVHRAGASAAACRRVASAPFVAGTREDETMPEITIYTRGWCPYCQAAKALLKRKGAAFTEIDLDRDPDARGAMLARAGGRTSVPQIFIGETHVGGSDDIHALDASGGLDPLLQG